MASGQFGGDSSVLVSNQFGDDDLLTLATDLFGEPPVFWGRYFTSAGTGGTVEYRHRSENDPLRQKNIRVVPIARQTLRVNGTQADGSQDAQANVEDLIDTFGKGYLSASGGEILMFLDVEGSPSLTSTYYMGWAQTVVAHSRSYSDNAVTVRPCLYATQADDPTWKALVQAVAGGATCDGVWVARWMTKGCAPIRPWSNALVTPDVKLPCDIFVWQYANECHGGGGFDSNIINPNIDKTRFLGRCVLPPASTIALQVEASDDQHEVGAGAPATNMGDLNQDDDDGFEEDASEVAPVTLNFTAAAMPKPVPQDDPFPFAVSKTPMSERHWPVSTKNPSRSLVSYMTSKGTIIGNAGRMFMGLRNGGARFHCAVDLFANEGDEVVACEAGKIVNFYAFYPAKSGEMTFALLIEHNDFVVNYGEVKANSNKIYKWKIGDNVEAGQAIARVSATAMTHFETYMKGTTRNERFMKGGSRPPHLLNPTVYLLEMNSI